MASKKVLDVYYDEPNNKIIWGKMNNQSNSQTESYLIDFSLNSLFINNGNFIPPSTLVGGGFFTQSNLTSDNIISYKGENSYSLNFPFNNTPYSECYKNGIFSSSNIIYLGNLNYETTDSVLKYINLCNFFNNTSCFYCKNVANLFSNGGYNVIGYPVNFYSAEDISYLYYNCQGLHGQGKEGLNDLYLCGPFVTNMSHTYESTDIASLINIGRNVKDLTSAYRGCTRTFGEINIPYGAVFANNAFEGCGDISNNAINSIYFPYSVEKAYHCFCNIRLSAMKNSEFIFNIGSNINFINNSFLETFFGYDSFANCFFSPWGGMRVQNFGNIIISAPYHNLNFNNFLNCYGRYAEGSFNCIIDCKSIYDLENAFQNCCFLNSIIINNLDVAYLNNTFSGCSINRYNEFHNIAGIPKIIIKNFNKANLKSLCYTFTGTLIRDLNNLPLNIFSNNITNIAGIFSACRIENRNFTVWCGENVENMHNAYYGLSLFYINNFNAACGNNVIDMSNAYYNSKGVCNFVCGENVINMAGTYAETNSKESAVCGSNVINMTGAYENSSVTTPVCGPLVKYFGSAFRNCKYLNNNYVCGDNVINMSYAYSNTTFFGTPKIGNNVTNASHAYDNCRNLFGPPDFGEERVNNEWDFYPADFSYCYANCQNLYGTTNFNGGRNFSSINFLNIFYGRGSINRLNIYIKYDHIYNSFISSDLIGLGQNLTWTVMENGVYNTLANIYIYRNKFNYLNTSLLTQNLNFNNDSGIYQYNNIVYELQSENIYSNTLNTEGSLATYKIEDRILHISTNAEHLYFNENMSNSYFCGNLQGNLQELFYNNLFEKVINMYDTFTTSRVKTLTGIAICGPNTIDFSGCYFGQNISEAICGDNVIDMSYTYNSCNLLTTAICGENVVNMAGAYGKCSSLTTAVCGNNVTDMRGSYSGCSSLIEPVLGPKVINFAYAYENCSSLENTVYSNNIINMAGAYLNCQKITNATIGKNVIDISYTFRSCYNLNTISLSGTPSIKNAAYAFYNCYNFKFNYTYDVTNRLFNNCTNFAYAFYNCASLVDISFENNSFTSIEQINMTNCFAGRLRNENEVPIQRLHIHVKNNSIFNDWLYNKAYEVFGTYVTWNKGIYHYYNNDINVYVYHNLTN